MIERMPKVVRQVGAYGAAILALGGAYETSQPIASALAAPMAVTAGPPKQPEVIVRVTPAGSFNIGDGQEVLILKEPGLNTTDTVFSKKNIKKAVFKALRFSAAEHSIPVGINDPKGKEVLSLTVTTKRSTDKKHQFFLFNSRASMNNLVTAFRQPLQGDAYTDTYSTKGADTTFLTPSRVAGKAGDRAYDDLVNVYIQACENVTDIHLTRGAMKKIKNVMGQQYNSKTRHAIESYASEAVCGSVAWGILGQEVGENYRNYRKNMTGIYVIEALRAGLGIPYVKLSKSTWSGLKIPYKIGPPKA